MTSRWKYGILLLLLIGLGIVGLVGLLVYRSAQTRRWRHEAETALEQQQWDKATRAYSFYLGRVPDDVHALRKYADANLMKVSGRLGALQNAATAYHQILRYQPQDREAEDRLLELYARMRSYPTLEYYAREFLNHRPKDPTLLRVLADALRDMGRHGEAVTCYRELVALVSDPSEIYEQLVFLLRAQNQVDTARSELENACAQSPQNGALHAVRAKFLAAIGETAAAQKALEEARRLSPDDPFVLRIAAEQAAMNRDWATARELLEQALARQPENASLLIAAAQAYVRLGQVDKALAVLEKASPLFLADHPDVWITLGDLQITAGNWDAAEQTIAAFLDSHPEQKPIGDYLRGRILLAKSDPNAAIELFAAVARQRPNFMPAQFYLAIAYLASGQESLGRSALESYLYRYPGDERAKALLAWNRQEEGSLAQLARQARDMLAGGPDSPDLLVQTAFALFRAAVASQSLADHVDTVVGLYERAIRLRPTSETAYQGLLEALVAAQQIDAAATVLSKAESNGLERGVVLRLGAYLDLVQNRLEEADRRFQEFLALRAVGRSDMKPWIELFIRRGQASHAVDMLTRAIEVSEGDERVALEMERIAAALQADRLAEAFAWLDEFGNRRDVPAALVPSLNRVRMNAAISALERDPRGYRVTAEKILKMIRDADRADAHASVIEAYLFLNADPPAVSKAKALLTGALRAGVEDSAVRLGLATCCLLHDDLAGSAFHVVRAAESSGEKTYALRIRLARRFLEFGRPGEALGLVRGLWEEPKVGAEALAVLVWANGAVGDVATAQTILDRLQQQVQNDEAWRAKLGVLRGLLFALQGQKEQAQAELGRVLEEPSANLDIARMVAEVLLSLHGEEEAGRYLENYVTHSRRDVEGLMALAVFQYRMGSARSTARCISTLSELLFDAPAYVPALRLLAETLLLRGESGQAAAVCDRLLTADPEDASAWFAKSRALFQMPTQKAAALDAVTSAIRLMPLPEFYYFRGTIYMARAEYGAARSDLEQAASTMSRTPADLDLRLARVYVAVGDSRRAASLFDAASQKAQKTGETLDPILYREVQQELQKTPKTS
ncbi:MAG TPA: tetratricopeptide repeat protein [Candidatus Hydrogenedentes bacterium]|mgnify:CR=1 FL=1|nr:tetratricopeptide repeat protein [Candidatus Hydrogenedentota bacterium]HOL77839.1 tetratricopeptide repeat protein [Candidatus Hydrogenedentota bacterium]HPO86184.1 tetratricopeptide repeat protein [Candidatus Hydrogenedentota bacterium]